MECPKMIKAANIVLESGITLLKPLFETCFPHVTCQTTNAKRRLLQIPLAALLMKIDNNNPKLFVIPGMDYEKLINICELPNSTATTSSTWSKVQLQTC